MWVGFFIFESLDDTSLQVRYSLILGVIGRF